MDSAFERLISRIYGQYCWGFDYDPMLNLSFNIGEPQLYILEPMKTKSKNTVIKDTCCHRLVVPEGKWTFHVRIAYWKLILNNTSVTRSSSKKQIRYILELFSGQILKSIQIEAKTGATTFYFDIGGILKIYRCRANTEPLWEIFFSDDPIFAVLSNGLTTSGSMKVE